MSHRSKLTHLEWGLSIIAGWLAVGVVGVVALLVLLYNSPALSAKLEPWIPAPVARFFAPSPAKLDPAPARSTEQLKTELEKVLPPPRRGPPTVAGGRFTMGSTKEDVLRIQGIPSYLSEDVWKYGNSEIYFKNNRVTGWHSATTDPLKAR
jgi:hypothetical protein